MPLSIFFQQISSPTPSSPSRRYSADELLQSDGKSAARLPSTKDFTFDREIAKTFFLTPGSYVIIPTTYYPNQDGDFLLRVMILDVSRLKRLVSEGEDEEDEEEATNEEVAILADDEGEISDSHGEPGVAAAVGAPDDAASAAAASVDANVHLPPRTRRPPRRHNNSTSFSEDAFSRGIPKFLEDLFRKHVGDDEEIDFDELQKILRELLRDKLKEEEAFSKATCM